jgi:hypothetical protein
MVEKRMQWKYFFGELIRNFMIFIEPGAQSQKNSRIPEMSKNFQFFWNIADLLNSWFTILPNTACHIFDPRLRRCLPNLNVFIDEVELEQKLRLEAEMWHVNKKTS